MSIRTITPQTLHEMVQQGQPVDLIDVRTPKEYRELHAVSALSMPLDVLNPSSVKELQNGATDRPLYVICGMGSRAEKACESLVAEGIPHVLNVEGGTKGWQEAGLPVIVGKKSVSLERQLRIVIGTIVLIGTILGYFVHPLLLVIAAFPAVGLIVAGLTDICPMAMLLAGMPWNSSRSDKSCCVVTPSS